MKTAETPFEPQDCGVMSGVSCEPETLARVDVAHGRLDRIHLCTK
ncbi:hypothetical protein [Streptomyces sp. AC550_RSS872]|nr:hypothetical protein [Streptomyces sp. AC550_RSS872]